MSTTAKKPIKPANKFDSYQKTDVLTADRQTILLMLYKTAIVSVKGAIKASEEKNLAERGKLITKAQTIVSELHSTLNFEGEGGAIAAELERLYDFISQRLLEGTLKQDIKYYQEALNTLETLYEAWDEAIAGLKNEKEKATK